MNESSEYLTQEKFNELQAELNTLVHTRRKEIAEHLEYAKSLGDLAENAEYHEARDMQANIEDRIAKLEMILKSALIVSTHSTSSITLGSEVTVEKEKDKSRYTYMVVGSEESDIAAKKISLRSPLGEAMIGKQKGQSFTITTPGGTVSYKVIDIT